MRSLNYKIYQFDFYNGLHIGKGNLDTTEYTVHSDTFFSALFQEAVKLKKEEIFLKALTDRKIVFSDLFPYIGRELYIPRPMSLMNAGKVQPKVKISENKLMKNLKYIPWQLMSDYMKGIYPVSRMDDLRDLGKVSTKVSVGIMGNEEPQPYRVSSFHFEEGNGLYSIVSYESLEDKELFEEILECLSFTGLGGKKSSGLGRFEWRDIQVPKEWLESFDLQKYDTYMLLSTALPISEQLDTILKESSFSLIKRAGFIDSTTYSDRQMKKNDLFVFAPGSVFKSSFNGQIVTEEKGGNHPIYRYEMAFLMGVSS